MKKTIIISLTSSLIFFILGYFIGNTNIYSKIYNSAEQSVKDNNTFQAGWEAAKKRLVDTGYLSAADNMNINIEQSVKDNNTFQAGWEAAKKRLVDTGFGTPNGNIEISTVIGQVVTVKDNSIIFRIAPLEPLSDLNLDERVIKTDNKTKIYIYEPKDKTQYQKEMEEYAKKMQEQAKTSSASGQDLTAPINSMAPPEYFIKKEVSLSDIKIGTTINVVATDKDIKNIKEFAAAEISYQDITPPPTVFDQPEK
jgi:hypothetical protein